MSRSVSMVLLLTFAALVMATLWVPCRVAGVGDLEYCWIGGLAEFAPPSPVPDYADIPIFVPRLDAVTLALEYLLILAIGGLLALGVRTRRRRREAESI